MAPVCDNCSKHKLPIFDPVSKPERVCNLCFDVLRLSDDELRILNIVLIEYTEKLKGIGLYLDAANADKASTDQPVITKKRMVECLEQIGQHELARILSKQGKISNKLISYGSVRFTTLTCMRA